MSLINPMKLLHNLIHKCNSLLDHTETKNILNSRWIHQTQFRGLMRCRDAVENKINQACKTSEAS